MRGEARVALADPASRARASERNGASKTPWIARPEKGAKVVFTTADALVRFLIDGALTPRLSALPCGRSKPAERRWSHSRTNRRASSFRDNRQKPEGDRGQPPKSLSVRGG